ncbi:restriction endonuclease [Bowmanella yangjiangensis]|uniref:Restriction endonuclease n=1 Tax=Bowmanella yangjiangensis TaxID=2811230 RepID=A0ABS3CZF4_9ALTE|nr:restriction endonuclease [Bowmanella yangjiangensis]MBN7822508.1 restriction endonuclease [Bowmanella yangjiangensis]
MQDLMPPWKKFEDLVKKILEAQLFDIQVNPLRGDNGFDFTGTLAHESWAIEVKYYRTARVRPSLIESAAARVISNGLSQRASKAMLIVSSLLTPEIRVALESKYSILFVDRVDLRSWATVKPSLIDELDALLELDPNYSNDNHFTSISFDSVKRLERNSALSVDNEGTALCEKLATIKKGKSHWAKYETFCTEALHYLFPNDLSGWHKQMSVDGGISRYDFVCRAGTATEFWKFLVENLNSRYVVFEFKNYSEKIKQGQVLTTEKYLLERALRKVAIIFTRSGADKNAVKMMQGAMREHGKLILPLDDELVRKMLLMKENGNDPTDLLFEITDNFLLSLPR